MNEPERSAHGSRAPSRVLAATLREEIASGQLSPGDKLPSERTLAATYNVARNTAREAIRLLAEEALVTAQHGRGVFVRERPRLMRFGQLRYSPSLRERTGLSPFRAEVEAQGRVPSVNCSDISRVAPPEDVAERLGLDPETDTVARRENWYYADDEPMQLGITFIPWTIAEGTALSHSADLGPGSLYARFADQGHEITRVREEVSARMPTHEEATGLQIPDGVPVIDLVHTGIDQHGDPFEVTRFIMRADFTALDYSMPVEE